MVDKLADFGTFPSHVLLFHVRPFLLDEEWGKPVYLTAIGAVLDEQVVNCALAMENKYSIRGSAVSTYYRGMLRKEQAKPTIQQGAEGLAPSQEITISQTQNIISSVASKCGRPMRPKVAKLPDTDEIKVEMFDLMTKRSA